MIWAATGHRPDKTGYDTDSIRRLRIFARTQLALFHVVRPITVMHCGLALGWDLAVGEACLELGIPVHAVSPFPEQASKWPLVDVRRRQRVIDRAVRFTQTSLGYERDAYQWRNIFMVNESQVILALFNGSNGGTRNCLEYAIGQQRPVKNVWPMWAAFQGLVNVVDALPSLD